MRQSRIWIGTAISLVFLVLLLRRVDRVALMQALMAVDARWLVLALVVFGLSIVVRVARWRTILAHVQPIPAGDAAELMMIGFAANNILPARTGEVVRAVLMQRRHGGSMVTTLGTIVVERVFDGLILVLMLAITLVFIGGNTVLRSVALIGGIGFGGVALVLVALAVRPALTRGLIDAILSLPPAAIGDRLRSLSAKFLDGLAALGSARTWGVVGAASVATWCLEATTYWIVGTAFGLHLAPIVYFAVCGAANLTVAVPSTSGSIGPYEYLVVAVVTSVGAGVTDASATAYAFGLHMFVLLPVTIVGLLLLWRRDLGLSDLTRAASVEAPSPSVPR